MTLNTLSIPAFHSSPLTEVLHLYPWPIQFACGNLKNFLSIGGPTFLPESLAKRLFYHGFGQNFCSEPFIEIKPICESQITELDSMYWTWERPKTEVATAGFIHSLIVLHIIFSAKGHFLFSSMQQVLRSHDTWLALVKNVSLNKPGRRIKSMTCQTTHCVDFGISLLNVQS